MSVGGLAAPAMAAGGSVIVITPESGNSHNGLPVFESGTEYDLAIGYGSMNDGQVSVVEVPDGVTIPAAALVVPPGNTAVAGLALDDEGNLVITFADPFPTDINQGQLDLKFVLDIVGTTDVRELTWGAGEGSTQEIIVTKPGDQPQPTTTRSAKTSPGFSPALPAGTVSYDTATGQIVIDETALAAAEIVYTITVDSKEARDVTIADALGAHLTLVPGSLTGSKTVRDDNDFNPEVTALSGLPDISGTGWDYTFEAEANSQYTFTYKAKIADTAALRAQLQTQAEPIIAAGDGGNVNVALGNTATVNLVEHTTSTTIGTTVPAEPRPNPGQLFGKTSSVPGPVTVEVNADGTLVDPVPVTYTLSADLTGFAAFADGRFSLDRNVVIRDVLPSGVHWLTGDGAFITATGITLTPAAPGTTAAQLAGDDYVGQYLVDGQTLLVNVGKNTATAATIQVKAAIRSVAQITPGVSQSQITYSPTNEAWFQYTGTGDGHRTTATTQLREAAPTPSFGKTTNLPENTRIDVNDDGDLVTPVPLTYTLSADLTSFAGLADTRHALTSNVIVTDTLPATTRWVTEDAEFLSASGIALTEATGAVDATTFAGDAYAGQYLVDGQTLRINLGHATGAAVAITAKAEITTLDGVTRVTSGGDVPYTADAIYRGPGNTAAFTYTDSTSRTVEQSVTHRLIDPKAPGTEIDHAQSFNKTAPAGPIQATSGQSVDVPFTFTVGNGVGDITKSVITDFVDHSVFDVTEANLSEISDGIVVTYEWYPPNRLGWGSAYDLDATYWDLTLNGDGDLEWRVNEKFADAIDSLAAETATNRQFTVTITLPTKPLVGKQTMTVVNNASYSGADIEYVYTSSSSASATTFGTEMELRKRAYDRANDRYTSNLRAEIDADGELVEDEFIYRIEMIPHGTFSSMVTDIVDVLPAGLEFIGFVNPADVPSGNTAGTGPYTIPGTSLQVTFDAADNTVTIERGRLTIGTTVALFFKVRLAEWDRNVGITNVIGGTSTTITPTDGYPLEISKLSTVDADALLDGGVFEVRDADGDVVLSGLVAIDGKLRDVSSGDPEVPTVSTPGSYTVHEISAPAGYVAEATSAPVEVAADGESAEVRLYNEPVPVGSVELSKTVAGLPSDLGPDEFPVTLSWTVDGVNESVVVDLPADGTVVDGPQNLPVGTVVTVVEDAAAAAVAGYTLDTTISAAEITVVEGANVVTVTNTYTEIPVGSIELSKTVAGLPSDLGPDEFPVTLSWTVDGVDESVVVDLPADGTSVDGPQDLPVGTVVTVAEDAAAAAVAGYGLSITQSDLTVVEGVNAVTVTNTYTEIPVPPVGSIEVSKTVAGLPSGEGPDEFPVTLSWTVDGVADSMIVDLPADGTVVDGPQDLPVGTVVTVAEDAAAAAVAGYGLSITQSDLTVVEGVNAVTVTNTYTEIPVPPVGSIEVSKTVAGLPSGEGPDEFPVTLSWTVDGVADSMIVDLPADGTVVDGPQDLPVGTVVTVAEDAAAAAVAGYGLSITQSDLTVVEGVNAVTVTNTYTEIPVPPVGSIELSKTVAGLPSDLGPDEFPVTLSWTVDGVDESVVVNLPADGTSVDGPQDLPVGTVVTVVEDAATAAVAGYTLDTTISAEEITVVEGVNAVIVTNTYTEIPVPPVGSIELSKTVAGLPSGEGPDEFPVTLSWTVDGVDESVVVNLPADGTVVDGPQDLPVGTVVTVVEDAAAAAVAGYTLDTTISAEEITVVEGVNAVTVTNTYTEITVEPVDPGVDPVDPGADPVDPPVDAGDDSVDSGDAEPSMPATGGTLPIGVGVGGLVLLSLGLWLVVRRRRAVS
nr:DUF5979 domain-containing protein [Microbacterium invictum]